MFKTKKEPTKIASVKHALFMNPSQVNEIKKVLKNDALRGQQNFRTNGRSFRRGIGVHRLNGLHLRHRNHGVDGAAVTAGSKSLRGQQEEQRSKKPCFHDGLPDWALAISLTIS